MHNLRRQFLLDPGVTFLNHGSFGATPRKVFRVYQNWQKELERQPVEFLGRRFTGLMREARNSLADYIHSSPDDVVYTPNVTVSVNIVAHSLQLGPDDEVLATDHEYGACDRIWRYLAKEQGFCYKTQAIPVPMTTKEEFLVKFWEGVTPRTKVIFLSHITSPTALILPVEEVCARAQREGILTFVDGAHTPGQIPLDVRKIGADFYGGNLHKWLCAPKGAGFLFARPEVQKLLKPLIVSWGYESETPSGSTFVDYQEWTGTRDIAAYLAVPEAIKFQVDHNWNAVRNECHQLVRDAHIRICKLTDLPPLHPDDSEWFAQLVTAPLPDNTNLIELKERLYNGFHIEVPLISWNGKKLIRISIQGYNTQRDVDTLIKAVKILL
jgi:isopenicillin-N epimerase